MFKNKRIVFLLFTQASIFSLYSATIEQLRKLSTYTPKEINYCVANLYSDSIICSEGLEELLQKLEENDENLEEVLSIEVPWFQKHASLLKGLTSTTKKDVEMLQKYKKEYKKMDWTVAVSNYNKPSSYFALSSERVRHLVSMIIRLGSAEAKKAFIAITDIVV